MSKSESRRTGKPPPRLFWPASLVVGSNDKAKNGRKRPRDIELWVDKFAPSNSADLCVAPKKVNDCRDWIREATHPIQTSPSKKLLVLVGSPGSGKSTMVRVLASELDLQVHSWNESFVARTPHGMQLDQVLSVDHSSALDSFQEFLVQCGAGFHSLNLKADVRTPIRRSLILLEDLPNLHGLEAEARFRRIMTRHFHETQVPTVLVFSDVSEGKHKPGDLERLIDPQLLYSPASLICQIHPVTKPKMKKIIEMIGKQENFKVTPSLVEDLHLQSHGDIRHAIMTLQVQSCNLGTTARSIQRSGQHNERDTKLSTFHMLGKILYAKRTLDVDGNSQLAFDPEEILAQSDMGVRSSLQFLAYHSTDFFTDIEDLGHAFSLFSDAAILLDNPENSYEQNPIFPERCASSIAGRAVARTNHHPAPKKFRQLSTPKVFDVLRKRRHNESFVLSLAQRLSACHLSPSTAVAGSHAFVMELLPTLRLVLPDGTKKL